MSEINKKYYINARVTKEEKEKIQRKSKEKGMSISALILSSLDNNITINLDTSDYRDLVIQFRRIGNNINTILKRIHFTKSISDSDILTIERNQEILKIELDKESKKIKKTKQEFENITPRKLRNMLKEEDKIIPMYLIYDEISDHLILQLRLFIQLLEDEKWEDIYAPYIEIFIKYFHPTHYEYEELVHFSDELDTIMYRINRKTIKEISKLNEDDFDDVLTVLNKYRKESDN